MIVAFLLLMSLTLHGWPAWAVEPYLGGRVGGGWQQDTIRFEKNGPSQTRSEARGGLSFMAGLSFAQNTHHWRVEMESFYQGTAQHRRQNASGEAKMKVNARAFFINGFYDFQNDTAFAPFVGGGLGGGRLRAELNSGEEKKKKQIMGHIGGGLSADLGENMTAALGYRRIYLGEAKSLVRKSHLNQIYFEYRVGF